MNDFSWKETAKSFFANRKDSVILFVVFLLGLILIHQGLKSYQKKLGIGQPTTIVLIASHTLAEGSKVTEKDVQTQEIPSQYVPIGVLKPQDLSKISGFILTKPMSEGELLFWNSMNVHYNYQSPSVKIEQGYRAVSISVDATSSISYSVQPGDHVDLISTMNIPGENKPSSFTLLQNVTVMSTGDSSQSQTGYSTIALMVLPKEAIMILHAAKFGQLSMVLRNPFDIRTNPSQDVISDQDLARAAFRNSVQTERDISLQNMKNE